MKVMTSAMSGVDRPNKKDKISKQDALESGGSVLAALATTWVVFAVAGITIGFGFFLCWFIFFLVFYAVLLWRQRGILQMKDGLATVAVWSGAVIALVALLAVVIFVIVRGGPIVVEHFPRFLVEDTVGGKNFSSFGVGESIVGTAEQVGIATCIAVPIAYLTATYIVESRSALARTVATVIDAMTGTPSVIAGLFIYLLLVIPNGVNGQNGFRGSLAVDNDAAGHVSSGPRGHPHRSRLAARSRVGTRRAAVAGRPSCRTANGEVWVDNGWNFGHCQNGWRDGRGSVDRGRITALQLESF